MNKLKLSISAFILAILLALLLPFYPDGLVVPAVLGIPVLLLTSCIFGSLSWSEENRKGLSAVFAILPLAILIALIVIAKYAADGFVDSLN